MVASPHRQLARVTRGEVRLKTTRPTGRMHLAIRTAPGTSAKGAHEKLLPVTTGGPRSRGCGEGPAESRPHFACKAPESEEDFLSSFEPSSCQNFSEALHEFP